MLRYDRSTRHPPNYLSGRQQWQVLRLVIGLGLILMLMNQFRNPRAIEALGIFFGAQPRSPQAAAGDHSSSVDDHDPATEGPRSASSQLPVRFEGLREVEDNTPFRREDTGPWFQLLGILHDASKSQLTSGAIPNLTAVQLLEQPEAYRGRLITLHGTARQSIPIDPLASRPNPRSLLRLFWFPELEFPALALRSSLTKVLLAGYHRVGIQQNGASVPIVVFALRVPDGFPAGEPLREQVSVTGYFFKNWLFDSGDGLSVAPVVLAKSIDWQRPRPAAPPVAEMQSGREAILAVATAAGLALVVTCWLWRRSLRPARPMPGRPTRRDPVPDFSQLAIMAPQGQKPFGEGS